MGNYYKAGTWNAICDRCGFEFKSDELRMEWTGLMVCHPCWEPRHPQDLIRPHREAPPLPWVRPEPTDVFIETPEYITTESLIVLYPEQNGDMGLLTEG